MSRIIKFVLLFVLVTTFFAVSSQGTASASSLHASHQSVALNDGCYSNNGNTQNGENLCNGDDPASSGCTADAYTVTSGPIENTQFQIIGLVELRFSPHCKTNWGRVTSYNRPTELNIAIGYGTCESGSRPSLISCPLHDNPSCSSLNGIAPFGRCDHTTHPAIVINQSHLSLPSFIKIHKYSPYIYIASICR